MRYRVFKLGSDGTLSFEGESIALGNGPRDIRYIAECHGLGKGDVVYIADMYLLLQEGDEFLYLGLARTDIEVGGEMWGPAVAQKLYRLATAA